jgi:hypothetical protein
VRDDYEDYFDLLASNGYARDKVLLAWDFVTASRDYVLGPVLDMRAEALEDVAANGVAYVIDDVDEAPNENILRIVTGTFEVPSYLTEDEVFAYDADHRPVRQETNRSFPFTKDDEIQGSALELPCNAPLFVHEATISSDTLYSKIPGTEFRLTMY